MFWQVVPCGIRGMSYRAGISSSRSKIFGISRKVRILDCPGRDVDDGGFFFVSCPPRSHTGDLLSQLTHVGVLALSLPQSVCEGSVRREDGVAGLVGLRTACLFVLTSERMLWSVVDVRCVWLACLSVEVVRSGVSGRACRFPVGESPSRGGSGGWS